ncbi:hypothetical protein M422DRAFT_254297 [Sphaerobolus stellatus SS14]|uniref:Uncharacterized protein n=1 Tax=Sphaerobolus stellatus (strain SS14) TaxID=990650 RepID=A0A0C9V6D2_SPHS4|nr:hypothetical protein M422DRAFT_254297 [Sphaerobolus stellatus SS14]
MYALRSRHVAVCKSHEVLSGGIGPPEAYKKDEESEELLLLLCYRQEKDTEEEKRRERRASMVKRALGKVGTPLGGVPTFPKKNHPTERLTVLPGIPTRWSKTVAG